jgi:hypothetical protein
LLFSLGTYCLQLLNIGIVALNPKGGTDVGTGFRALLLSCLAIKSETGRFSLKVSYQLSKEFTVSKWILICNSSDSLIHKQGYSNPERLNFVPWCLIFMCPHCGLLSWYPSSDEFWGLSLIFGILVYPCHKMLRIRRIIGRKGWIKFIIQRLNPVRSVTS